MAAKAKAGVGWRLALRKAVQRSRRSMSQIARGAGVPVPTLTRFMRGERGLNFETADKLAGYLGLTVPQDDDPM